MMSPVVSGRERFFALMERAGISGQRQRWGAGEIIYVRGEPARELFWLHSGWVRLYRLGPNGRSVTVRICFPGKLFGEESLSLHSPYRASFAEAVTESVATRIPRDALMAVSSRFPDLMMTLLDLMSQSLQDAEAMASLVMENIPTRLAYLLTDFLGDEFKGKGETIELPLTHAQLASLIGAARECVTVSLRQLEREGVVETRRGKLIVYPKRLKEVFHHP